MKPVIRRLISFFRVPYTRWYLKKDRTYRCRGLLFTIQAGVFHPGLFPSTKMLRKYLEKADIKDKTLLELGCGTALLSVLASRAGALVTASDLSEKALLNAKLNADRHGAPIRFIHSDLFENFPAETFDWVLINPPYYRKNPANESEIAWYCGEDLSYFKRLFASLKKYAHEKTMILMTLTGDCEIPAISAIAHENKFEFIPRVERKSIIDGEDFLFEIIRKKEGLF